MAADAPVTGGFDRGVLASRHRPAPDVHARRAPAGSSMRRRLAVLPLLLLATACEPGSLRYLGFGFAAPLRGVVSHDGGPLHVVLDLPAIGTVEPSTRTR